ncbi:MAG TPA: SpoIIE family protein phosphatase [Candidatus Saccharimonadales bacterium]|nr:SpoIIE family protein phosphatase [Candidatus Saccharimonadales bacterium]
MYIEAGKAERPVEGQDRLVLLEDLGRFAVFDGAGNAIASSLAAKVFREQQEGVSLPSLGEVFERVQEGLMEYQDNLSEAYKYLRGFILTTGTALGIGTDTSDLEFAHAGDSAMCMFDFEARRLSGVTRQDVIGHRADVDNFLGSPRHILTQYGSVTAPEHVALALFSDGVGDKANPEGAVTEGQMVEILGAELSCDEKAEQIIEASSINDDRAVIVVERKP